jgi:hypothetical protein
LHKTIILSGLALGTKKQPVCFRLKPISRMCGSNRGDFGSLDTQNTINHPELTKNRQTGIVAFIRELASGVIGD